MSDAVEDEVLAYLYDSMNIVSTVADMEKDGFIINLTALAVSRIM
jgi:hypothetical protein